MTPLEQSMLNQIMTAGLAEPEQEYPTGYGKTRFDFAWPEIKLAVEVEGGTWIKGRHSRPVGFARDAKKYNRAVIAGWRIIRATSDMVASREAINDVVDAFNSNLNAR